jgi:hypothetical protein
LQSHLDVLVEKAVPYTTLPYASQVLAAVFGIPSNYGDADPMIMLDAAAVALSNDDDDVVVVMCWGS